MRPFHFRLATLLRIRLATRDQRRLDLAESRRAEADLQQRLVSLAVKQSRMHAESRQAASPGPVDVTRLAEAHECGIALRSRQAELERERIAVAGEAKLRRQALLEADRGVRALEKLRENQRETHRIEQGRQDVKQLDEAALRTGCC